MHIVGSHPDGEFVDAFVSASRALVAVAARSLAGLGEDVTLPQYRVLVELASKGPRRSGDLALALTVNPSTASRMIERLVRKSLVRRTHPPHVRGRGRRGAGAGLGSGLGRVGRCRGDSR